MFLFPFQVTVDPKVFWREMSVNDPDCNLHKLSCILDDNFAINSYKEKKAAMKMTTTTTTTIDSSQFGGAGVSQGKIMGVIKTIPFVLHQKVALRMI